MGVLLQIDFGIKRTSAALQNASESPKVKEASKKFEASKDALIKRAKESVAFVQDTGVKGYVQYAKDLASKYIEGGLDFAQSGMAALTHTL